MQIFVISSFFFFLNFILVLCNFVEKVIFCFEVIVFRLVIVNFCDIFYFDMSNFGNNFCIYWV